MIHVVLYSGYITRTPRGMLCKQLVLPDSTLQSLEIFPKIFSFTLASNFIIYDFLKIFSSVRTVSYINVFPSMSRFTPKLSWNFHVFDFP